MKRLFVIGLALVVTICCVCFVSEVHTTDKTANDLLAEAYLVNNYGTGDYNVEISKVDNGKVYFYWSGNDMRGYSHTTLSSDIME